MSCLLSLTALKLLEEGFSPRPCRPSLSGVPGPETPVSSALLPQLQPASSSSPAVCPSLGSTVCLPGLLGICSLEEPQLQCGRIPSSALSSAPSLSPLWGLRHPSHPSSRHRSHSCFLRSPSFPGVLLALSPLQPLPGAPVSPSSRSSSPNSPFTPVFLTRHQSCALLDILQ